MASPEPQLDHPLSAAMPPPQAGAASSDEPAASRQPTTAAAPATPDAVEPAAPLSGDRPLAEVPDGPVAMAEPEQQSAAEQQPENLLRAPSQMLLQQAAQPKETATASDVASATAPEAGPDRLLADSSQLPEAGAAAAEHPATASAPLEADPLAARTTGPPETGTADADPVEDDDKETAEGSSAAHGAAGPRSIEASDPDPAAVGAPEQQGTSAGLFGIVNAPEDREAGGRAGDGDGASDATAASDGPLCGGAAASDDSAVEVPASALEDRQTPGSVDGEQEPDLNTELKEEVSLASIVADDVQPVV